MKAIWNLGFRPFFLLGALWSALHVLLWVLFQSGAIHIPLQDAVIWHAHEMIFGFASAIVAGFLLTASQNWTGQAGVQGEKLQFLVLIWAAARILSITHEKWLWLYAVIDLMFYPLLGWYLKPYLAQASQKRNWIFLLLFFVLFQANLAIHNHNFEWFIFPNARSVLLLSMYAILLMISVIGGRVIPFFTSNAHPHAKPLRQPHIEKLTEISLAVSGVSVFLDEFSKITALLCFIAFVIHASRWILWKPWKSISTPILWILYAGYVWIPIGLALRALASLSIIAPSPSTHAFTAGAIGIMIFAMISRVALGHTGRSIHASRWMIVGYISIIICAITRVFGPLLFPAKSMTMIQVSGLLWVFSFFIYTFTYAPILLQPRIDGKKG